MGEPVGKATFVTWHDVKKKTPPACHMILAARGDTLRVGEYYVSTHPLECVEDDGIRFWAHMPKPTDKTVTVSVRTLISNINEGMSLNGWRILGKGGTFAAMVKPLVDYLESKGVRVLQ
jgi:hypothetical protein